MKPIYTSDDMFNSNLILFCAGFIIGVIATVAVIG